MSEEDENKLGEWTAKFRANGGVVRSVGLFG
jgi:hypothetical protein